MKKKSMIIAAAMLLGAAFTANAQVTIGSDKVPESFSTLELISNNTKGLRLPQMTTVQRDAMEATAEFQAEKEGEAMGLQIFNTTVKCVQTWNGAKWLSPCEETCDDCVEAAFITAFVNVMYDFQHQTLEAYNVPDASEHQWQVRSADEAEFKNISGATSAFYEINEYYINSFSNDTLYFRCLLNDATGERVKTPEFEMLFIRTHTTGYGADANGVKYLTLQKGEGGTFKAGTVRIALLNLGQSEGNDAGDLGDMYQWGRIADGHQKGTWTKDASRVNKRTLSIVSYSDIASDAASAAANYDNNPKSNFTPFHQVLSTSDGYGKYIAAGDNAAEGYHQWYNPNYDTNANDNYLWGQSTQSATGDRSPGKNGNDPCPTGWKVPSRWDFHDMYNGNGTDVPLRGDYTAANNKWTWREPANTAYGGAIITNASGEKVFLPTVTGVYGNFWSSTYSSTVNAYTLAIHNNSVSAGDNNVNKAANDAAVRCVAE